MAYVVIEKPGRTPRRITIDKSTSIKIAFDCGEVFTIKFISNSEAGVKLSSAALPLSVHPRADNQIEIRGVIATSMTVEWE